MKKNCRQIQDEIIQAFLDQHDIPSEIEDHLHGCEDCLAFRDDVRQTFMQLDTVQPVLPPEHLVQSTLVKIGEKVSLSREKHYWWKIGVTMAACLPLIIAVHVFWLTVIPRSIAYFAPIAADIFTYFAVPVSLLGISLVYGSLPVFVGKYLNLQREVEI